MLEENQLTPILDVPPELILELAVGVDTFDNICRKFEYNTSQIEQLRNDAGLKARVTKTEAELQKDGFTHKYRAAYGADTILRILITRGMDPSTPLSVALDIYKELVKTGDLVPKQAMVQQASNGFSITINLPEIGAQPGRTIEAKNVTDLGTNIPILGTGVNSDDEGPVDTEANTGAGSFEIVNRKLNSSLELPEDYQDE